MTATESHRPSPVPWVGTCPRHWVTTRLKATVRFCQNGLWGDEPDGADDIICVRVADFDRVRRRVALDAPTLRSIPSSRRAGRVLQSDDLLIEKSGGGELQPVGCVVHYDHPIEAICSNFVARMPVADGHNARYLCYLNETLYSMGITGRSIKQTTGIQNLDAAAYLDERVEIPPFTEQRFIAAFLDRKTAAIDALIAKKERLIELLQEKRQALISQAVTKGLEPDVPIKDSGISWLKDIPTHWGTERIASISSKITNGFVGPTREILVDDGVRYLQSLHIKGNRIRFTDDNEYFVTQPWSRSHERSVLNEGDVLVVQTGDIGQVACVPPEFEGSNCHALIIISPVTSVVLGPYLAWTLNSVYGQNSLRAIQTGALHPHLNCTFVREIVVPIPPVAEQTEIVAFIDQRDGATARLVERNRIAVDLLREYRQALISAAVTGKIEIPAEEAA